MRLVDWLLGGGAGELYKISLKMVEWKKLWGNNSFKKQAGGGGTLVKGVDTLKRGLWLHYEQGPMI